MIQKALSSFRHMGLQKRMVLLIFFFLGATFGLFAYLGLQAVHRSTELIFNERLALAKSIASDLDNNIAYATQELERMASLAGPDPLAGLRAPEPRDGCLSMCHARAEVRVSRVGVTDDTGQLLSLEPHPLESSPSGEPPLRGVSEAMQQGRTVVSEAISQRPGSGPVVSLATPLRNEAGEIIGTLALELEPWRNVSALNPLSGDWKQGYHLELISQQGLVVAGADSESIPGQVSGHLDKVSALMEERQAAASIHHAPEGGPAHVIAFAPLETMPWGVIVEQENETALSVPNGLRRDLFLFGGVAMLMLVLLVWVITRGVVKPVRQLTLASQKMAAGDLEQPVAADREDEVGQLSRAFDEMRVKLKTSQEEQARLVETLQELDRLKTEFVARASHELRTPLTSIKSLTETLLREDLKLPGTEQREFLQSINGASDRLANIITELLTVSRIEAGRVELREQAVALGPLIGRVASELGADAVSRVSYHQTSSEPPVAWADTEKVTAVLVNLLTNALKYSPPGSPVTVSAARDPAGTWVVVSVTDQGAGIPPSEMDKLFERYSHVESLAPQGARGLGLGLYICKSYVEAMGGSIWAESNVGKGSTFSFRLPVSAADPERPQGTEPRRGQRGRAAARRPRTLRGRVLVVDDEVDVRRTVQLNLESYGLQTITAASGPECLDLARAERPDVVILDVVMPGMDGFEVARRLKADAATRSIPIIFLSARTQEEDEAMGYEAGGSAYVTKPFSPTELARVVASHLAQRPQAGRGAHRTTSLRDP